jgi:ribosomal small subunit protein bTHX
VYCGRGDRKTARGKRFNHSFGNVSFFNLIIAYSYYPALKFVLLLPSFFFFFFFNIILSVEMQLGEAKEQEQRARTTKGTGYSGSTKERSFRGRSDYQD